MTELLAIPSSSGSDEPIGRREPEYSTQYLNDIVPGVNCRVHWINRDAESEEPPINVLFGFGTDINTKGGRQYVESMWKHLEGHQGIALEMDKYAPNLEQASKWEWEVFDRLLIPKINIAGMSTGGAKGFSLAGSAQGRVDELVLASSIGTLEGGVAAYAKEFPNLFMSKQPASETETKKLVFNLEGTLHTSKEWGIWLGNCIRNARRSRHDLEIIFNANMFNAIKNLDGQTRLTMIVGDNDSFSSHKGTLQTVEMYRERTGMPEKAQATVVEGMGHNWTPRRELLGKLYSAALQGHEVPSVVSRTEITRVTETTKSPIRLTIPKLYVPYFGKA
jgi:hypothetical protein